MTTKIRVLMRAEPGLIAMECLHVLGLNTNIEVTTQDTDADILLSLQYDRIVSKEVLDRYPIALNLHNAKLPEYRGSNTISHAILNGEKFYTSTLHWMVPQVDAGDIAYQATMPIHPTDTAEDIYYRSVGLCKRVMWDFVEGVKNNQPIPRIPQQGVVRFYPKVSDSYRRIDINASAERMAVVARAWHFPPYSRPAFMVIDGREYGVSPLPLQKEPYKYGTKE